MNNDLNIVATVEDARNPFVLPYRLCVFIELFIRDMAHVFTLKCFSTILPLLLLFIPF